MTMSCDNLKVVDARSGDEVIVNISTTSISQFDQRKPLERVVVDSTGHMGTIIGVGQDRNKEECLWVALDGDNGRVRYFTYIQVNHFNTGRNTRAFLDDKHNGIGKTIEKLLYRHKSLDELYEAQAEIDKILKKLGYRSHEIMISSGKFSGKTLRVALTLINDKY